MLRAPWCGLTLADLHALAANNAGMTLWDPLHDESRLALIRDRSLGIAAIKGHAIGELSIVPDHLHTALRGNIEQSQQEIALSYLNNLAYALGQNAVWQFGYYAGTFGEYDMGAVREEKVIEPRF